MIVSISNWNSGRLVCGFTWGCSFLPSPFAASVGVLSAGAGLLLPGLITAVTSLARSRASPTQRHVAMYMRLLATASHDTTVSGTPDARASAIRQTDGPQS